MKVRSDILKIYKSLHTWVGITTGMLLFIAFFAGALTMFKEPINRWIAPPQQVLPSLDSQQYDQLIQQVLFWHPAARSEFTLHLQQHENITAPVSWQEQDTGRHLDLSALRWHATLDAEGQLQDEQILPSALAELIDLLHRTAGVPGSLGHDYLGVYLLGVASVLYFLAIISGLIVLLPTLVKDFFAIREGRNKKRFWLDAHNVIGITSLPFHIMISLTVIVFAFHDVFYDSLNKVVYGDESMFGAGASVQVPDEPYPLQTLLPVQEVLKKVKQQAPEFEVTELLYIGLDTPRPRLRVSLYNPGYVVHGPITAYLGLHPFTGEVGDTSMLPTQANSWGQMVSSLFALHFGSYGGNPVRWVYFLLGLSGAFLFYSGNLLWVESRRKKQKPNLPPVQQPASTRWMAVATVGVCLGSMAATGFTLVAGKWLYPWVDNINHCYVVTYYLVFLLAVAYALWQGAAKSSVHLLQLCAVAALLIPLTSLMAYFIPALGLWAHVSLATLSVDAVALLFAVFFWRLAIRTARRVYQGGVDSVWSAKTIS